MKIRNLMTVVVLLLLPFFCINSGFAQFANPGNTTTNICIFTADGDTINGAINLQFINEDPFLCPNPIAYFEDSITHAVYEYQEGDTYTYGQCPNTSTNDTEKLEKLCEIADLLGDSIKVFGTVDIGNFDELEDLEFDVNINYPFEDTASFYQPITGYTPDTSLYNLIDSLANLPIDTLTHTECVLSCCDYSIPEPPSISCNGGESQQYLITGITAGGTPYTATTPFNIQIQDISEFDEFITEVTGVKTGEVVDGADGVSVSCAQGELESIQWQLACIDGEGNIVGNATTQNTSFTVVDGSCISDITYAQKVDLKGLEDLIGAIEDLKNDTTFNQISSTEKCLITDIEQLENNVIIGSAAEGENNTEWQSIGGSEYTDNPSPTGTMSIYTGVLDDVTYTVEMIDYSATNTPSTFVRRNLVVENPVSQGGAALGVSGFDNTTGSSLSPNAFLICFDMPVQNWGATFLDLESDAAFSNAHIITYDASESVLSDSPIIYPNSEDGGGESHFVGFTRSAPDVSCSVVYVGATNAMQNQNSNRLAFGGMKLKKGETETYTAVDGFENGVYTCKYFDSDKNEITDPLIIDNLVDCPVVLETCPTPLGFEKCAIIEGDTIRATGQTNCQGLFGWFNTESLAPVLIEEGQFIDCLIEIEDSTVVITSSPQLDTIFSSIITDIPICEDVAPITDPCSECTDFTVNYIGGNGFPFSVVAPFVYDVSGGIFNGGNSTLVSSIVTVNSITVPSTIDFAGEQFTFQATFVQGVNVVYVSGTDANGLTFEQQAIFEVDATGTVTGLGYAGHKGFNLADVGCTGDGVSDFALISALNGSGSPLANETFVSGEYNVNGTITPIALSDGATGFQNLPITEVAFCPSVIEWSYTTSGGYEVYAKSQVQLICDGIACVYGGEPTEPTTAKAIRTLTTIDTSCQEPLPVDFTSVTDTCCTVEGGQCVSELTTFDSSNANFDIVNHSPLDGAWQFLPSTTNLNTSVNQLYEQLESGCSAALIYVSEADLSDDEGWIFVPASAVTIVNPATREFTIDPSIAADFSGCDVTDIVSQIGAFTLDPSLTFQQGPLVEAENNRLLFNSAQGANGRCINTSFEGGVEECKLFWRTTGKNDDRRDSTLIEINNSLQPECLPSYERNIECVTEENGGFAIGHEILVITKIDCEGVPIESTYWDAKSDPIVAVTIDLELTSENCAGEVVCNYVICDDTGKSWNSCAIFFEAGEPIPIFYDEGGVVGQPICSSGICPPCMTEKKVLTFCAFDPVTFAQVATVKEVSTFDMASANNQPYSVAWLTVPHNLPFDTTGFRIESCDFVPSEACIVEDTTTLVYKVCYDVETPTTGTSWSYDGTNQFNCSSGSGALSELIEYGTACGTSSYCFGSSPPTGDPANAAELLTANNIWDGTDWGGTSTCQYVANAWLPYESLSGTAATVTLSFNIASTVPCHGGYGWMLYDNCAGAFLNSTVTNITGSGTAVNNCGAQGVRMSCGNSGTVTADFNTSGVSDLSCLYAVSWAFSRAGQTPTSTDQVQNVTINGQLPSSASCVFDNCVAVANQLNADDPNGNNWTCDSDGRVCGTILTGDPTLYSDLVTADETVAADIDTCFAEKVIYVPLSKSCGAEEVEQCLTICNDYKACDLSSGIELTYIKCVDCEGVVSYPNGEAEYFPCGVGDVTSCSIEEGQSFTFEQESGLSIFNGGTANAGIKSTGWSADVVTATNTALESGCFVVIESSIGATAVIGGPGYSSGLVSTGTFAVQTNQTIFGDACPTEAQSLYGQHVNGNASTPHTMTVTIFCIGAATQIDPTSVCDGGCPERMVKPSKFVLCDDGNADFQFIRTETLVYLGGDLISQTITDTQTDLTTPYTVVGTGVNCDPSGFGNVTDSEKCDSDGMKWTQLSTIVNSVQVVIGYYDANNVLGTPVLPFIPCPIPSVDVEVVLLCDYDNPTATPVKFLRHYYYENGTRSFVDTNLDLSPYTVLNPNPTECGQYTTIARCIVDANRADLTEYVITDNSTGQQIGVYWRDGSNTNAIASFPVESCERYYNKYDVVERKVCFDVLGDGTVFEQGYHIRSVEKYNIGTVQSVYQTLTGGLQPPTAIPTEDCNCSCGVRTFLTAKVAPDGTLIDSDGEIGVTTTQNGNLTYDIVFSQPLPDDDYRIQLTTILTAGRDSYTPYYFNQTVNGFSVEINEGDNGPAPNARRSNEFMITVKE